MWTIVFAITTAICAIGWLKRYISCAALAHYIAKNQSKLPTDKELKECADFVIKRMLHDITK